MVEWWQEAGRLLIDQKLSQNDVAKIVSKSPVEMREGLEEVILRCKDKNIPFLVFSAGIASNYLLLAFQNTEFILTYFFLPNIRRYRRGSAFQKSISFQHAHSL